jgi:Holliday junction resolvase
MSRKSKGINAERDLIHKFWATKEWSAVRIAGSGSMKYPSADILATNKLRKLAIECKTSKETSKYLTKDEVEQLKVFAKIFGAEPWIGVKFNREEWFFLNVEDLKCTGNNFLVSVDMARNKGLLFEELIK